MASPNKQTTAVVLAAGEGKRLKSGLPKVLHKAAGKPLMAHVLAALAPLELDRSLVVVSPRQREIELGLQTEGVGHGLEYAVQDPARGTGDATRVALEAAGELNGDVLVLSGDTPLLRSQTLSSLVELHRHSGAVASVLTARVADPTGYGRIIRGLGNLIERIVEDRDASSQERLIREVNAGVYVFDAAHLTRLLNKVDCENAQGEYYLTDVIGLLRSEEEAVVAFETDPEEVEGVNTRAQLAHVSEVLRRRTCARLMEEGVGIVDPSTTYIDATVEVARDATIHPFTFLEGDTQVGEGASIGPHARIVDSIVGPGAEVSYSVVRQSRLGPNTSVGPFASLRPGTVLEDGAHLGTFVEAKNSVVGEGSKANHLAYLGDARIGKGVNIGAGTITCNWDGEQKHETVIEDDAYIGSDTMLVAPTRIGKRAATGAGSVVRGDVPDDALAVGVPARVIEGKGNRIKKKGDVSGEDDEDPRQ